MCWQSNEFLSFNLPQKIHGKQGWHAIGPSKLHPFSSDHLQNTECSSLPSAYATSKLHPESGQYQDLQKPWILGGFTYHGACWSSAGFSKHNLSRFWRKGHSFSAFKICHKPWLILAPWLAMWDYCMSFRHWHNTKCHTCRNVFLTC